MTVILRNGPLNGKEVVISRETTIYRERISGRRLVYVQTVDFEPDSMKRYFDYRESASDATQEPADESEDFEESNDHGE